MMKVFMAEDNVCAQNLLKLVAHGNAIIAEILRLKDHVPKIFMLDTKETQQKYQNILCDFSYFKVSENIEKLITTNVKLQDLDDEVKENHLEIITRFYLLFENIYQYIIDLNLFVEQLSQNLFIQQNIETIMMDIEGKQLLCESLYLYGVMLLLTDLYIVGPVRERLLVAFYRYSISQSQSNIDQVCQLLRDSGYNQQLNKRPMDYPVEYFARVSINMDFVEKVVGKLRSEDIYNQLSVYTSPEHQESALSTQGSMLVVCLFFIPQYLHSDISKMREITDKFFSTNWIISIYMGITLNVIEYWENFKAAKQALCNICNLKLVKEISIKQANVVVTMNEKLNHILKEGTLTDDFVLDNINKIINILITTNSVLRWLLLHTSPPIFFDTNKRSRQMKEVIFKETKHEPPNILELLIKSAELELKIRDVLYRLLKNKQKTWDVNKNTALSAVNSLTELFSGSNPATKISENLQLKKWFDNIAKQISSLTDPTTSKTIKKITQLIQALNEVEEFHGIKSTSTIIQFLSECKGALKDMLRVASLKDEYIVTLETIVDISYAWCTIDSYTKYMQDSIKEDPAVTSRLRAVFLKLSSAMEIPLLRINQAHSDDLISVSQYYSNELIKYIQKVLQIIPEMVFNIVEKIIELQTWSIKEVPTRLEKDKMNEYAQLEERMEVARLTHSASTFTTGILDMRSTLVGVIRVDPAELLEEGLLTELNKHICNKFMEFLEPQPKKNISISNLLPRLQKLADSMDGYKRSLEYIQDYINIHGLKIWQKQVSMIIKESVAKEISVRKGVVLVSPSASFMGSLARQIVQLTDPRTCVYINVCTAWFDIKSHHEIVNTKMFAKLNESIGVVGLHGLDTLYAFMIKNTLQNIQQTLHDYQDKFIVGSFHIKNVESVIAKAQKVLYQLSESLVIIGTLQIFRKQIALQLNTTCKFDSAHLEATLRTLNTAIIEHIKQSTNLQAKPNVPIELMEYLEEFLLRCGIYEPYEKVYIKSVQEFTAIDMGRLMAVLLISQIAKLQIYLNTGDLISRKLGECIDGYPLLVGIYTLLHQTKTENIDIFIDFLCDYLRATSLSRSKIDTAIDNVNIIRSLELFVETFKYPFYKLEDKLPMLLLTHTFQKYKIHV